jgi:hypothetical protein
LFNEFQSTLIRERLICRYSVHFKRKSVRLLLEDIIFCETTAYEIDDGKEEPLEASINKKYDADFKLKNDTIHNFLKRKTETIKSQFHMAQLAAYLINKDALQSDELSALSEVERMKFPVQEMILNVSARKQISTLKSGEYVAKEDVRGQLEIGGLICATPNGKGYMGTKRQIAWFKKGDGDSGLLFQQRIDRGDFDGINGNFGQIIAVGPEQYFLFEAPPNDPAGVRFWQFERLDDYGSKIQIKHNTLAAEFTLLEQVDDWLQKAYFSIKRRASAHLFVSKIDISYNDLDNILILDMDNNIKLLEGAKYNDIVAMVEALINGADINYQCRDTGWTAGHWVANNACEEAFAVLHYQENELPLLRDAAFADIDEDDVEARWKESISGRNPLIRDNDGYMASARIATYRLTATDIQSQAHVALCNRMMGVEAHYAGQQGQNYWDIVWAECDVPFPKLEA